MLIALLVGWTFLGFTTQVVCVVLGGVGFGPPLLRSEVAPRLVPQYFNSRRWLPVLGWLIVLASLGR